MTKAFRLLVTTYIMYSLHTVLAAGVHDSYTDVMLWAAMCLAFHAALRISEFAATTSAESNHLCLGVVSFHFDNQIKREFLSLTLHASKTDPFQEGCTLLVYATGHPIFPVLALKSYLSLVE